MQVAREPRKSSQPIRSDLGILRKQKNAVTRFARVTMEAALMAVRTMRNIVQFWFLDELNMKRNET